MRGRLSKVSGEVAATEASLERKGSLGLKGGIGILDLLVAFTEREQHLRRRDCWGCKEEEEEDDEDEVGMEETMGTRKHVAIIFSGCNSPSASPQH